MGKEEYNRESNLGDLWRKILLLKLQPRNTGIKLNTGRSWNQNDFTCKHASYRYRHIVVNTPDTDVVVLVIAFSKDIDSIILVKTRVKSKAHIISIERIIDKLVKLFSPTNINSATDASFGLHTFTGCDTVSAFWWKRKVRPLKLLLINDQYIFTCALLGNEWAVSEYLMKKMEKSFENLGWVIRSLKPTFKWFLSVVK